MLSEAEIDAINILRTLGYEVSGPYCPDCHDYGIIGRWNETEYWEEPCPRGHPPKAVWWNFSKAD